MLDRQAYKKKFMTDRKLTVLNTNDNLRSGAENDWDTRLKNVKYTGGQLLPSKSEFKHVLKRRKSRQSTNMPTQVDIEY